MVGGLDELRVTLAWIRQVLHRHISRHGHRMVQAGGRLDNLFVSLTEARTTLTAAPATWAADLPPPPPPTPMPVGPRLAALATRFGLGALDVQILMACAAPTLDVDLGRLYTFAWADFTQKQPTVSFLCELILPDAPLEARAALLDDAPLVRHRLVRLAPTASWGPECPRGFMAAVVPEAVTAWLTGQPSPILRSGGAVRLARPSEAPAGLSLGEGAAEGIDRALDRAPDDRPTVLVLVGDPRSGRRSALHAATARRGRGLLLLDLDALTRTDADDAVAEVLLDALREARLRGAMLALAGDDLFGDDARRQALMLGVRAAVRHHLGPVALITTRSMGAMLADLETVEVRFDPIDSAAQVTLWRRVLGDAETAERLAARFDMRPGAICAAARKARVQAGYSARGPDASPDIEMISQAVRADISHALDTVAERVTTTLGWDDVVLPDDVMETLHAIRDQARYRSRVYDTWGFRQKVAYGRGLACLFAGPPGTGKTMMATILAAELGREIYRVDLSRVVSKWVGETEKNLSRVFDEAERAQIILFFDEADSLFSGRTEVKAANDRFANMEVNYLLQRMEQFDGMSILTTNFERGIDEAFKRRLKFKVQFPLPDADQRAALWQRCIPGAMPIEDDIEWAALGRRYKLSGGSIKNTVVRAAFYAAATDSRLTEALLHKAAADEMRETGRL